MDTLYQLLEWNPVQVGSTFQGGDRGGTGRPWEPVQAASGKLKFEDVSSEMQKKCEKRAKNKRKKSEKKQKNKKKQKKKCKNNAPKVWGGRPAKIEVQKNSEIKCWLSAFLPPSLWTRGPRPTWGIEVCSL